MNDPSAPTVEARQLSLFHPDNSPVVWADLNDVEIAEAMHELTGWVDWLVGRYHLDARAIPPCWARHGELVEELSALRGAWLEAYAPDQPGDAALRWHADFAYARERLVDWVAHTGCRADQHRASQSPDG